MPSNKELQDAITVAAGRLKVPADLEGNNSTLAERLKGLNALVAVLPAENDADEEAAAKAKADEEAAAVARTTAALELLGDLQPAVKLNEAIPSVKAGYVIAPGRSLTSLRGILVEGDEVSARDFANVESFDLHVERKFVVAAE